MKVVTRFGEIEIEEQSCILMEDGLVGIPQAKRFCLVNTHDDSPFQWLQCLDEPALALAVVCPNDFFRDYSFDLQDADVEKLELDSADEAVVLTTVTVDRANKQVTTNLLGPIIINRRTLKAKQVVLSSDGFSTKHLLFDLSQQKETLQAQAA